MRRRVNGSERVETMPHFGLIEAHRDEPSPRAPTSSRPRRWRLRPQPPASAAPRPLRPPQAGTAQGPPPGMPPGASGGRGGMGGPFGRPAGNPTTRVMASVIDRLEAHGIKYFKTSEEMTFKGERFRIATSEVARPSTRDPQAADLTGAWQPNEQTIPAGSLVIPMDQPLARLAFMLLDPRSDDGLMAWNILDPMLGLHAAHRSSTRSSGRWKPSRRGRRPRTPARRPRDCSRRPAARRHVLAAANSRRVTDSATGAPNVSVRKDNGAHTRAGL